jgi:hypothetical protein
MSEQDSGKSIPGGGPHAVLRRYLIARSPAALLADAAIVLVLAFIASHLWTALADAMPMEQRSRPAESLIDAITRPNTLMQTAYSVLFYLSWFLAIWAAARQLASGRFSADTERPPARPGETECGS